MSLAVEIAAHAVGATVRLRLCRDCGVLSPERNIGLCWECLEKWNALAEEGTDPIVKLDDRRAA